MNKFFKSRMIRSMIPYFILIIGAILVFRLSAEFRVFTDAVSRFWAVISPFLTGAVFAYIFNVPCSAIQRLIQKLGTIKKFKKNRPVSAVFGFIVRKSRIFSVLLLIIIMGIILAAILNILIPAVSESVDLFVRGIDGYEETVRNWLARIYEMNLPDSIRDTINEDAIITALRNWVDGLNYNAIATTVMAGLGGFASTMFNTFLAIVSTIYLLIEKDKLKSFVIVLLNAVTSTTTFNTIMKYSQKLDHNFRQYIFAQTIDGIILGSIMTIILLLFGSPFAIVLGLILGIVNYIPYFGSIFGTAFAVLVVAFTQGLPTAALAAVIMFAIQQFDGNFMQPKLMGKTFSLSPFLVISSVTIGMHYGGVLGMLVAIPIVAILKDAIDTYIEHRHEKKNSVPNPEEHNPNSLDNFMDRDFM